MTLRAQARTTGTLTSGEINRLEPLEPTCRYEATTDKTNLAATPEADLAVARFLHSLQVLLRASRLYHKNHPRLLENLETAEHNLRAAFRWLPSVAVGVERNRLVVPMLGGHSLANYRRELGALAEELSRCGVASLIFLPETNLGELDVLARLLRPLKAPRQDWPARLAEHHVFGIRVNTPIQRKVDTTLASLMAAILACGGTQQDAADEPPAAAADSQRTRRTDAANLEELVRAMRLLAKLTPSLDPAQPASPQETARAFHAVLAEAERRAVTRIVEATARLAPREDETYETYIGRAADALVFEFAGQEFRAGRLTASELRSLFAHLGRELGIHAARAAFGGNLKASPAVAQWADETHAEQLYERFWAELPVREVAKVLRGPDAWCVTVASLRHSLEQLFNRSDAVPGEGPGASGSSSPREARQVLLNYARGLESEEGTARRAVAAGLAELHPLLERLWPVASPEELTRGVVRALERETSPGIAGLLTAVTENLARVALRQADYAGFERILHALERAPRDADHAHLTTLAARLVADEHWLLLVDAALANRPLEPVLPRLLRRDPERLLDRMGLLLTAPNGLDALPAMARLLRAVGEPAIGALETRLFEPRRQRAATAVKLLVVSQPERLVAALPRALPSWDWSLQDLAVSELARLSKDDATHGVAQTFLAALPEAHPMVAPMMLDQIGLSQETAAVPLLLEIAAGENEPLRDVFIRIKAVEALGRMRVAEAADLLRTIVRRRHGLTHAEPAGLRAAAEEALALLENRPSSARVRAAHEALEKASLWFPRPRRYLRIPVPSPIPAQIEGPHSGTARVRTISLGGAFLESKRRLAVGDSLRLAIHAGLRRIHSTAVVRNLAPNGGGIEFVHMQQEDRERLRRLVRRLLRS